MSLPTHIAVLGGGRMGAGIAHAFTVAGCQVLVIEADESGIEAARKRLHASLTGAHERGQLDGGVEQAMMRVRVAADLSGLREVALVIESVPEDLSLKQTMLVRAAAAAPEADLATNTSALSIAALAEPLDRPGRLIGLHFFNPVPSSDLVEVVVGPRTDEGLIHRAQAWVADLGRTAVTVNDSPGFASSRLGITLALEAMRMLEEGVASANDIDTAVELGYRHPSGPLRTTDVVGLDVRLAVAEHLEREIGPRFAPPKILRDKVAAGEVGRKAGKGFYDWT